MKYFIIGLIVVAAILIAVFTFIVGAIKFALGGILLGVAVIALFVVWGLWKAKN